MRGENGRGADRAWRGCRRRAQAARKSSRRHAVDKVTINLWSLWTRLPWAPTPSPAPCCFCSHSFTALMDSGRLYMPWMQVNVATMDVLMGGQTGSRVRWAVWQGRRLLSRLFIQSCFVWKKKTYDTVSYVKGKKPFWSLDRYLIFAMI